jgi:hypothetical protein
VNEIVSTGHLEEQELLVKKLNLQIDIELYSHCEHFQ